MALRRILTAAGHRVVEAGSAEEALELASTLDAPLDLLVSDIGLPELSGPALAEALRTRQRKLKVLYVSGSDDRETLGILDPLIEKPFEASALIAQVSSLVAR